MQYVMQGVMIATVVVMTLNAIKYFGSNPLQKVADDSVVSEKKDSVFTITNFKGQALFGEKCSMCHSYGKRDGMKGMEGFETRASDEKTLHEFIHNSYKVIQSGDPYYSGLYKEYNVLMPSFPELTDQDISDILEYMKEAGKVYGYD